MEGALLNPLFLLLILQLLGYTDVVLHKLVLLDIGGVVLLNYRFEKGKVSRLFVVYRNFLTQRSAPREPDAVLTLLFLQVVRQRSVLQHRETLAH